MLTHPLIDHFLIMDHCIVEYQMKTLRMKLVNKHTQMARLTITAKCINQKPETTTHKKYKERKKNGKENEKENDISGKERNKVIH